LLDQIGKLPTFIALAFRNGTQYRYRNGMTWPKNWHISSNISGSTAPIFAFFTRCESALHADDGFVSYFPICQGNLPWQLTKNAKIWVV